MPCRSTAVRQQNLILMPLAIRLFPPGSSGRNHTRISAPPAGLLLVTRLAWSKYVRTFWHEMTACLESRACWDVVSHRKKKLNSCLTRSPFDVFAALYQAMLYATGLKRDDMNKPQASTLCKTWPSRVVSFSDGKKWVFECVSSAFMKVFP